MAAEHAFQQEAELLFVTRGVVNTAIDVQRDVTQHWRHDLVVRPQVLAELDGLAFGLAAALEDAIFRRQHSAENFLGKARPEEDAEAANWSRAVPRAGV